MGRGLGRRRDRAPRGGRAVSETCSVSAAADGGRDGREVVAASRLARWLGLAATPTFAIMAALTAVLGGPADMLCSAGHGLWLGGMVPMYLLMSAFHSAAWLRLISGRRWVRTSASVNASSFETTASRSPQDEA
ncbi:hypothetical protein [Bradyrhizobium genosp. A]|uniref:hypothetical protein n=1 Tax=Bradyrhizobium genosp. A TaxID=83626 RepID=UPI003CF3E242